MRLSRRSFLRSSGIVLWSLLAAFPVGWGDAKLFALRGDRQGDTRMRVSMERNGGFTGIPLIVTVDTATLSVAEAEHLRQLIQEAHFFELPEEIVDTPQPDRFHYEITVQEAHQQHTVSVSEPAMPANLRPLVQWLTAASRRR